MIRVAAVQTKVYNSLDQNVTHIRKKLDETTDADFVCFPGLALTNIMNRPETAEIKVALSAIGERVNGRWCIVGGYAKREEGTFNEVYVLDRMGRLAHTYQKIMVSHLETGIASGKACSPLATDAGTIGVIECYDVAFTNPAERLVKAGAQAIFCPAFWPYDAQTMEGKPTYNGWPTQRAREQQVPLVFCDASHPSTVARSHILSAKGEVLRTAYGEQTLYAILELT